VKTTKAAGQAAVDEMFQDPDFEQCNLICNKGKHLKLKPKDVDTEAKRSTGAIWRAFTWGSVAFNAGPTVHFYVGGKYVDVRALSDRVIQKWEKFFADNNIP
jgi:hypothetical protein